MKFKYIGIVFVILLAMAGSVFGGPSEQAAHIKSVLSEKHETRLDNARGGRLDFDSGRVKLDIPARAVGNIREIKNRIALEAAEHAGDYRIGDRDVDAPEETAMAGSGDVYTDAVDITVQKVELRHDVRKFAVSGEVYEFGPHGLEFDQPVQLTLPYVSDEGRGEKFINIYYYNPEIAMWEIMPKVDQDFENNTITVEITHFSTYSPGVGSYVVNEGVSPNSNFVSNQGESVDARSRVLHMGSTDFSLNEVGLGLSIGRTFNSDDLWGLVDHEIKKTAINDKSAYSFAAGWRWALPELDLNVTGINFRGRGTSFITGSGTVYDLTTPLRADVSGGGARWLEGYKVYDLNGKYIIEIIGEQIVLECDRTLYTDFTFLSGLTAYYADGRVVTFHMDDYRSKKAGTVATMHNGVAANALIFSYDETGETPKIKSITHGKSQHVLNFNYNPSDITVTLGATSQVVKYELEYISETNSTENTIPSLKKVVYGSHYITPAAERKSKTTVFDVDSALRTVSITFDSGKTSTYEFVKEVDWTSDTIKKTFYDYDNSPFGGIHYLDGVTTSAIESEVHYKQRVERHIVDGGAQLAAGKTITEYQVPGRKTSMYTSSFITGIGNDSSVRKCHAQGCTNEVDGWVGYHNVSYDYESWKEENGTYNYPERSVVLRKYIDDTGAEVDLQKTETLYLYETADASAGYVPEGNASTGMLYFMGVGEQITSVYENNNWVEKDKVAHEYTRIAPHVYKVEKSSHFKGGSPTAQYTTMTEYDDYGQTVMSVGPSGETSFFDYAKTSFDKNAEIVKVTDNVNEMFNYKNSFYTIDDYTEGEDYPYVPGHLYIKKTLTKYLHAKASETVNMEDGFYASVDTGGFFAELVAPERQFVQKFRFADHPYQNQGSVLGIRSFGLLTGKKRIIDEQMVEESYFKYNSSRNLIETKMLKELPDGSAEWVVSSFVYNGDNQLTQVIDPLGNSITVTYGSTPDTAALIVQDSRLVDVAGENRLFDNHQLINTYDYDLLGRLTKKDSYYYNPANGDILDSFDTEDITYNYDNLNRVVKVFSGGLLVSRYIYNDDHNFMISFGAEGHVTIAQYDALDRVVKQERYTPYNNIDAHTRYSGGAVIDGIDYERDTYDNVVNFSIKNVACLEGRSEYTYDERHIGKAKTVTTSYHDNGFKSVTATSDYDALGRVIASATGSYYNQYMVYYDDINRVDSFVMRDYFSQESINFTWASVTKDWSGRVTESVSSQEVVNLPCVYNNRDLLKNLVIPESHKVKTTMGYNTGGNMIVRKLASGSVSEQVFNYQYDTLGNVIEVKYPDNLTESFVYNINNSLVSFSDKKGNIVTNVMDTTGAVRRTSYTPFGANQAEYTIGTDFNQLGLPISIVTDGQSGEISRYSYTYDAKGRMTDENITLAGLSESYVIERDYDRIGGVSTYRWKSNTLEKSISYLLPYQRGGDQLILRTEMTASANNGSPGFGAVLNNKGFGGIESIEYGGNTVSYSYVANDPFFRLEGINFNVTGVDNLQYSFDYLGNVLAYDDKMFSYDGWSRLRGESSTAGNMEYQYDVLNNRSTFLREGTPNRLYEYDNSYKMLLTAVKDGSNNVVTSYEYDTAGNMQSKTDENGIPWVYVYDARNQLVRVDKNGTTVGSYVYDHAGHRIRKTENGEVTWYVYDGNSVLFEKTVSEGNGSFVDQTFNVSFAGMNIAKYSGAGLATLEYHLLDHLGSRRAVLDSAGNVKEQIAFSVWGELESGSSEEFNYTGKSLDNSTGLLYFNARYYDPSIGRFITEDPAQDGANWYVYCNNNPLAYTDPTGLYTSDELGIPDGAGYSSTYDEGFIDQEIATQSENMLDSYLRYDLRNSATGYYEEHLQESIWSFIGTTKKAGGLDIHERPIYLLKMLNHKQLTAYLMGVLLTNQSNLNGQQIEGIQDLFMMLAAEAPVVSELGSLLDITQSLANAKNSDSVKTDVSIELGLLLATALVNNNYDIKGQQFRLVNITRPSITTSSYTGQSSYSIRLYFLQSIDNPRNIANVTIYNELGLYSDMELAGANLLK